MEKKQVSTFLKILQIPSDAPPGEIRKSLLQSGWNYKDAEEAVAVLYPGGEADTSGASDTDDSVEPKSQIVAQKYVKSAATEGEESQALDDPGSDSVNTETFSQRDVSQIDFRPQTTQAPDKSDAVETEQEENHEVDVTSDVTPEATPLPTKPATPPAVDPEAEKNRPHTDAPWLQQQVDIYDVTEEEREEMIRTVYRTNERLSPKTIHALLGIDVDLSEYEEQLNKRRPGELTWVHIVIILVCSVTIAAVALMFGLYYFEVGPYHPTLTGGR